MNRHVLALSVTLFFSCVFPSAKAASDPWRLCPPLEKAEAAPAILDSKTYINAESVSGNREQGLTFSGSVEVRTAKQQIKADQLIVSESPRTLLATDNIFVSDDQMIIRAERAELGDNHSTSKFDNVSYQHLESHSKGVAENITKKGDVITMTDASYSTCPEENPDWSFRAKTIKLNNKKDIGTITGATLRIRSTPILYLPWASFPISDKRKSGILYPSFGNTENGGFEFSLPFYWNIAPNYDATFTPHWITSRGTLLENELRYLGDGRDATVQWHYLPEDGLTNEKRFLYDAKVNSRLNQHWRLNLDGSYVSDDDYLQDFSNDLNMTSLSHLGRSSTLFFDSKSTQFRAKTLIYQTLNSSISPADYPYSQLPKLTLKSRYPLSDTRLDLSLNAEAIRFSHDIKQTGQRFDINPSLSYHWRQPSYFVTPRISWRKTHYELDDANGFAGESISRNLPTYSVDSGLFFERELPSGTIQTLEPRLFYLNTPYKDQSDIPVFDSTETSFNFYSMFRENSFNGIDRISDADQLTVALTSRALDPETGHSAWRGSLGQIIYFQDRNVTLPDQDTEQARTSDYAAELSYTPDSPWSSSASILLSADNDSTRLATWLTRYRGTNGKLANLEYRYRQDTIEQANLSFAWPVSPKWRLMGRALHSLRDNREIETLLGVEYENCCWKAQLVGRRHAETGNDEYSDSFYLQLVLKGLSSYGGASSLLRQSITGYNTDEK